MHRGPAARVSFCAMTASHTDRTWSYETFDPSFQAEGGIGKRRQCLTAGMRSAKAEDARTAAERAAGARAGRVDCASARGPDAEVCDPEREIEADLSRQG